MMFGQTYNRRKILVTGHTGFKGSWLCLWLQRLGAEVSGYSLPPPTDPSHFGLLRLGLRSTLGDVDDQRALDACFAQARPELVFHLAAQPLVRESYRDPVGTFQTNAMGTLKVLEACRKTPSVRAVVVVTSDKCYEPADHPHAEGGPMGGHDPYSASKGCAELLTASYRKSFFNLRDHGRTHQVLLATCRAGNVIGGGDWAADRLLPDLMKAAAAGRRVSIRKPLAVRPWQHVLDPLQGYLLVGQRLLQGEAGFAEAWNFGPAGGAELTVEDVARQAAARWPTVAFDLAADEGSMRETDFLRLDSSKAVARLGWKPVWDAAAAIERSVEWYKSYYGDDRLNSVADLETYICHFAKARTV